jgi:hypothetical protein
MMMKTLRTAESVTIAGHPAEYKLQASCAKASENYRTIQNRPVHL